MTTTQFNIGDRVKYIDQNDGKVDFGVITKAEPHRSLIWVKWDSDGAILFVADYEVTLCESDEGKRKFPPHKYADVIKHWADGGEVQYSSHDDSRVAWVTHTSRVNLRIGNSFWRIKPKELRYRVGLTKDNQVKVYSNECEDHPDDLKRWIDDYWKVAEID